jgi:hypothetical protein
MPRLDGDVFLFGTAMTVSSFGWFPGAERSASFQRAPE